MGAFRTAAPHARVPDAFLKRNQPLARCPPSHRQLIPARQALENEVTHFQARHHRIEDGHRLELARLKKEVEYHKRLRQVGGSGGSSSSRGGRGGSASSSSGTLDGARRLEP